MTKRRIIVVAAVLAMIGGGAFVLADPANLAQTSFAQAQRWIASLRGTAQPAAPAQPNAPPPIRVAAEAVAAIDVPMVLEGIGTVQGANTVAIRSRVEGPIQEVVFREGQEVRAGEVLFRVDPRPYRASVDQARAKLAQTQAQLANARADLDRYQQSAARGAVTRQTLDTQEAMVAQLRAAIENDRAALEAAQLRLDDATIRSPIDGRAGLRQIDAGNVVTAGSGTLVTITQMRPISVLFTLPESGLAQVNRALASGPVDIAVLSRDAGQPVARGRLELVDNQIDSATGTIRLKASLANEDLALWPGQFVVVRVQLETLREQLAVANSAIQKGPNGDYVYVVKPDRTVESRPVEIASRSDGKAVVARGLTLGEEVVTDGQHRLRPGMAVATGTAPPRQGGGQRQQQPRRQPS